MPQPNPAPTTTYAPVFELKTQKGPDDLTRLSDLGAALGLPTVPLSALS